MEARAPVDFRALAGDGALGSNPRWFVMGQICSGTSSIWISRVSLYPDDECLNCRKSRRYVSGSSR